MCVNSDEDGNPHHRHGREGSGAAPTALERIEELERVCFSAFTIKIEQTVLPTVFTQVLSRTTHLSWTFWSRRLSSYPSSPIFISIGRFCSRQKFQHFIQFPMAFCYLYVNTKCPFRLSQSWPFSGRHLRPQCFYETPRDQTPCLLQSNVSILPNPEPKRTHCQILILHFISAWGPYPNPVSLEFIFSTLSCCGFIWFHLYLSAWLIQHYNNLQLNWLKIFHATNWHTIYSKIYVS